MPQLRHLTSYDFTQLISHDLEQNFALQTTDLTLTQVEND